MIEPNEYIVICTDHRVELLAPDLEPEDYAGFSGNVKVYMTAKTAIRLAKINRMSLDVLAVYTNVTVVDSIRLTEK